MSLNELNFNLSVLEQELSKVTMSGLRGQFKGGFNPCTVAFRANSQDCAAWKEVQSLRTKDELDNLINNIKIEIESWKTQLDVIIQKPQNITPDNITAISPTNQNIIPKSTGINPLLILGGAALIALTVLKK